ncbi:Uncharacterized protein TCM_033157 [Theobroma cacao]|uniref:Uncharacterized protein n=1 Tax=Theobroma cacao TaxID=3641 RepID=A0A061FAH6_THECC|nr:Uncharacterized protein TCM_033157 [Theobroma cacao]
MVNKVGEKKNEEILEKNDVNGARVSLFNKASMGFNGISRLPGLRFLLCGIVKLVSEPRFGEDSSDIREDLNKLLEGRYKEKTKEAIAKGDICPRKVSAVRHLPPRCGRGAAPIEEDSKEDSSMCSDQGDDDPNDT